MNVLNVGIMSHRRVKLVRQTEMAECGLASLAMVAQYHGLDIDLGTLRRRFQPSLRGVSLKSLIAIADRMGLTTRAVKLPLERLADIPVPAILHWDMNHFVVLERTARGRALIHNPEGTSRWMTLGDVSPHFTGVALELSPAEDFEASRLHRRLKVVQLWRRVTGLKRALVQTLVLSLVLEAFVMVSPYYMQVAIDGALPALDRNLLTVLAFGFGIFAAINASATLLRSFVLLSAGTSLGYGIAANVARRLFRLPVAWFEKRHVGDVLSRFQSVTPIQQFMTQGATAAMIDGTLAVFVLALMFYYSLKLTAIALTAFIVYAGMRYLSFSTQRLAQEDAIITAGKEQSMMIESLRGIVTLRLFNRETARHSLWQTKLTDATNASVSLARIGIWQSTANTLVFSLETVVGVWLAMRLVMSGGFSLGMVFAYFAYKTIFLQRAVSLIDQSISFRMLSLHLERISDIALADQDRSYTEETHVRTELRGRIELRNVKFRYSSTDPLILDGIDLLVEPGDHVAITGPSGGGKSTLVKIILGLVEPDSGEVLIDDMPLRRFGYKNYHEQVAAVLQEDSLFTGSLADNIALFDDVPNMQRIIESSLAAAIHHDIMSMPMGYETLVGDMGSTLSGGQKQRVLLARALYRLPKVLVMDEGTAHLDIEHEAAVNAAISRMGITRIVVAHRAETVAAAKRVVVLRQREIVAE